MLGMGDKKKTSADEGKSEAKPEWARNEGFVPGSEKAALGRSNPSPFNIVQWSPQMKCFTPIHFM